MPRTLALVAPSDHAAAMFRIAWTIGSISAFLGVAAGAFGAHALKTRVSPELLLVYETGVRYQLIHAIALLAVGLAATHRPSGRWSIPGIRWLGAVTPLGGVCFLLGWLAVIWIALQDET